MSAADIRVYKKPPIIEAVIALHFFSPVELKAIEVYAAKRKARFPRNEEVIQMNASFNPQTGQTASNVLKFGRKLVSADGSRTVIAQPPQFAVSQLAPYTDWDTLCRETRDEWNIFSKIIKRRDLSHVSTRYINRIDIPVGMGGRVDLHKYFTIGLSLPPHVQSMELQTFYVRSSLLDSSRKYRCELQLASSPSPPLIDHISFTIDIDIATTEPVPANEDKLWSFVGSLRQIKNELFESCITPETRRLFQ
jgi:uncharacterized protein (TIGR04255 family)